jgi:nucleoside-diphosphate-sugar epimerase
VTILELAKLIARVVGYPGGVATDSSKPDGTPRKLLDTSSLINLGWRPRIELADGLASTYAWFLNTFAEHKGYVQPG